MSNSFQFQASVAVFGILEGKVLVVNDVFSSHKQETYPSTSHDENR